VRLRFPGPQVGTYFGQNGLNGHQVNAIDRLRVYPQNTSQFRFQIKGRLVAFELAEAAGFAVLHCICLWGVGRGHFGARQGGHVLL
jgi:hypothetical protein